MNEVLIISVYDQYSIGIVIGRYIGIGGYIGFANMGNVLSVLVLLLVLLSV